MAQVNSFYGVTEYSWNGSYILIMILCQYLKFRLDRHPQIPKGIGVMHLFENISWSW